MRLVVALLLVLASCAVWARNFEAHFPAGSLSERALLTEDNSRQFVLPGWNRNVRNVEFPDSYFVWQFDLRDATEATAKLELLNNYRFSLSTDGNTWQQVLENPEFAQSGSNQGWYELPLTENLGKGLLLLKGERSFPEEEGFGACVFELVLTGTDTADEPVTTDGFSLKLELPVPKELGGQIGRIAFSGAVPVKARLETAILPKGDLPRYRELPLPKVGAVLANWPLREPGEGVCTATLRDADGKVLARAVQPYKLSEDDLEPVRLELKQPYVREETELLGKFEILAKPEHLKGASLSLTLAGKGVTLRQTIAPVVPGLDDFAFSLENAKPGEYVLSATLERPGLKDFKLEREVIKLPPLTQSGNTVTFDEQNHCLLNGESFLPLGFLLVHRGDEATEARRQMYQAGYRLAVMEADMQEQSDFESWLDQEVSFGLLGLPDLANYLRGKKDFEGIKAVVSRWKDHPATFAWYLADEPEAYGDTPEILAEAYQAIKAIDDKHPVLVLTNNPSMAPSYAGCADVVMADPYPIPHMPLSQVGDWTEQLVKGSSSGQVVWMTPQGFGWDQVGGEGAPPTYEELRNMQYQALVHGAAGLLWWPWSIPAYERATEFERLAEELRTLTPALTEGFPVLGETSLEVGGLHVQAWQHEGAIFCVVVNPTREATTLRLALPDSLQPLGAVQPLFGAATPRLEGDTLIDELEPAGARVYSWYLDAWKEQE